MGMVTNTGILVTAPLLENLNTIFIFGIILTNPLKTIPVPAPPPLIGKCNT